MGTSIVIRPRSSVSLAGQKTDKVWEVVLRSHEGPETEYDHIGYVAEELGYEMVRSGDAHWLYGIPDSPPTTVRAGLINRIDLMEAELRLLREAVLDQA